MLQIKNTIEWGTSSNVMRLQRRDEKISKSWHIEREHKITSALDTINSTFGKGSLKLADQGSGQIKTSSGNQVK